MSKLRAATKRTEEDDYPFNVVGKARRQAGVFVIRKNIGRSQPKENRGCDRKRDHVVYENPKNQKGKNLRIAEKHAGRGGCKTEKKGANGTRKWKTENNKTQKQPTKGTKQKNRGKYRRQTTGKESPKIKEGSFRDQKNGKRAA